MDVHPLTPERLAAAAALVARCQADPSRHIGYDAAEAGAVAVDLAALEPMGLDGVVVASLDGRVVGLLGAEWDTDPPRCWWHGPYVAPDHDLDEVADLLYLRASALLPAEVGEQELSPDRRNVAVADFARRHGFRAEEASAVLHATVDAIPRPPDGGPVVGRPRDTDRPALARLHAELFPGTHTSGERLAAPSGDRVVVVARSAAGLVGYAVGEPESDGTGYLDYLGVAPQARQRGIGGALVAAVATALLEDHGCRELHLTVREGNQAARRLYRRLGFTEERLLVPWRRGFSLAAS